MAEPAFSLTRQVFLLYSSQTSLPLGTCFRIGDSGSYITATHVIRDIRRESIEIISVGSERRSTPVESIVYHSAAADWNRKEVVGVVTEGVRYSSHLGDDRVEAHRTVAASLRPLADWVESA